MSELDVSKKVETQDIPKILAAIQTAINEKRQWTLTVKGLGDGGIMDIHLVQEKSFK
jgi:hypothetical protein